MTHLQAHQIKAFLFDFDGVVMNTEPYYTTFWDSIGKSFLPQIDNFAIKIKGNTLKQIFSFYFSNQLSIQEQICLKLKDFEQNMPYLYIDGCHELLLDLKNQHIPSAIVTSSDHEKMNRMLSIHPEINELFDHIITANDLTKSKPDPEGFLLAAQLLQTEPQNCLVLEDSLAGIEAAQRANMNILALATTLTRQELSSQCDHIIDNFNNQNYNSIIQLFK